jgi:signal transduction histidine kinase
LTEVGLDELLRQLADAFTGRARVPISVEIHGVHKLSPDVQIAIYRIAQEALNNVFKHANATQARISLVCTEDQVELRVCDNGRGFDPATAPPGHMGMGSMRERAQAIGADLSVHSVVGEGTEVEIVWSENESALAASPSAARRRPSGPRGEESDG